MSERKQSFLERLTGTRNLSGDEVSDTEFRENNRASHAKPWSPAVNTHPQEQYQEEDLETGPMEYYSAENEAETTEDESDEAGLAIDIYESDNELIIQSMIAGVTPENLHVSITRDTVTLKGRRNLPQGIPDEHYVTRELYWGSFSREIALPYEINTDGAEAVEKYGLLIIRLPKLDTKKTAELKVKSI